jgi:hypothetical protein
VIADYYLSLPSRSCRESCWLLANVYAELSCARQAQHLQWPERERYR